MKRTSKNLFSAPLSDQAISGLRRDWLYARRHPRSADVNKALTTYTASSFTHHIASPVKKRAAEAEEEFLKYNKGLILPYILRIILLFIPSVYRRLLARPTLCHFVPDHAFPALTLDYINAARKLAERGENTLLSPVAKPIASRERLLKELKEYGQALLEQCQRLVENLERLVLKYWLGCTSAGGIPSSTEAHGLSLLSVHLSTIDAWTGFVRSMSPAYAIQRGGRNNGLVPV